MEGTVARDRMQIVTIVRMDFVIAMWLEVICVQVQNNLDFI